MCLSGGENVHVADSVALELTQKSDGAAAKANFYLKKAIYRSVVF
jgi:hypothetical protein